MRFILNIIIGLLLSTNICIAQNNVNWKDCFKDPNAMQYTLPGFVKSSQIQVTFVAQAKAACQGAAHPAVMFKAGEERKWIQFVDVNVEPEIKSGFGWNLLPNSGRWVFLDTWSEFRKKEQIFYTLDSEFSDVPKWGNVQNSLGVAPRIWLAFAYWVKESNNKIVAEGGVKWGFVSLPGELKPIPIFPVPVEKNEWNFHLALLRRLVPQKLIQ